MDLQSGDREPAACGCETFKDIKGRCLVDSFITLPVMDCLTGLESVLKEEFSKIRAKRYQIHIAKNNIAKAPRKKKKDITDKVRFILYSFSRKRLWGFLMTLNLNGTISSRHRFNALRGQLNFI